MIGAIAGDIIGSVYEHYQIETKDFLLFQPRCSFTDDTVLTVREVELMDTLDGHCASASWQQVILSLSTLLLLCIQAPQNPSMPKISKTYPRNQSCYYDN